MNNCARCFKELPATPGKFWMETWPLSQGEPALARTATLVIPEPQQREFICFDCLTTGEKLEIMKNAMN